MNSRNFSYCVSCWPSLVCSTLILFAWSYMVTLCRPITKFISFIRIYWFIISVLNSLKQLWISVFFLLNSAWHYSHFKSSSGQIRLWFSLFFLMMISSQFEHFIVASWHSFWSWFFNSLRFMFKLHFWQRTGYSGQTTCSWFILSFLFRCMSQFGH